ncbi:MAG: hypothetical protein QRY71_05405 [Candidatus Rhabdochlamydia sp.]
MNFTREPIIETIITPRDGYRLIVRSTKHTTDEDFSVDAVEIVSFGLALFFRSLDKPKPFLLPVADYQVVEGKEARVTLKAAQPERTIKIGGGKELPPRKEVEIEEEIEEISHIAESMTTREEKVTHETVSETVLEHKRERRRNRRRRSHEQREDQKAKQEIVETSTPETKEAKSEVIQEPIVQAPVAPMVFPQLIPPPTTLISASIQKYKDQQAQEALNSAREEIVVIVDELIQVPETEDTTEENNESLE